MCELSLINIINFVQFLYVQKTNFVSLFNSNAPNKDIIHQVMETVDIFIWLKNCIVVWVMGHHQYSYLAVNMYLKSYRNHFFK